MCVTLFPAGKVHAAIENCRHKFGRLISTNDQIYYVLTLDSRRIQKH